MRSVLLCVVVPLALSAFCAEGELSPEEALRRFPGYERRIVAEAVGAAFDPQSNCVFRLTKPGLAATWRLKDWRGNELKRGDWPSSGTLDLGKLPTGYYTLSNDNPPADISPLASRLGFAVGEPVAKAIRAANRFYSSDSALSWVSSHGRYHSPWNDGNTYLTTVQLMERAGIVHTRERLTPPRKTGNYGQYLRNAQLLKDHGIGVGGMFHDKIPDSGENPILPRDLVKCFTFCRDTAKAYGDTVDTWEFWNEPDIHYAPEPVWVFAAAAKAAWLGFKTGNPKADAEMGGLLNFARPGKYADVLLENDILEYTDAYVCHIYDPIGRYPEYFGLIRDLLKRHGAEDIAVRITECGTNQIGPSDLSSIKPGMAAQDEGQEMVLAEFYAKSQVVLQMEGIERCDYFVFGPFVRQSGLLDRGVMRRDGTVKPIWAAMRTQIALLADATLEGKVALREGLRAYSFRKPDGSRTLVYWKYSDVDTKESPGIYRIATSPVVEDLSFTIRGVRGKRRVTDIFGGTREVASTGGNLKLTASAYPSYVEGLGPLKIQLAPHPTGQVRVPTPHDGIVRTLIVVAEPTTEDYLVSSESKEKFFAEMRGETGRVRVTVWNLSKKPREGLKLVEEGGNLTEELSAFAVEPFGKREFEVTCRRPKSGRYVFRVLLDKQKSTRCTVPIGSPESTK